MGRKQGQPDRALHLPAFGQEVSLTRRDDFQSQLERGQEREGDPGPHNQAGEKIVQKLHHAS